jgi:hypothetical protein
MLLSKSTTAPTPLTSIPLPLHYSGGAVEFHGLHGNGVEISETTTESYE